MTQFISRYRRLLGPRRIGGDFECFEIGGRLDRYDLALAHAVDEKVSRGGENILLGAFGKAFAGCLIDTGIDFLPEVRHVAGVAPILLQELHQHRLQRQHFGTKPCVRFGRAHARARRARACALTVDVRPIDHPRLFPSVRGSEPWVSFIQTKPEGGFYSRLRKKFSCARGLASFGWFWLQLPATTGRHLAETRV